MSGLEANDGQPSNPYVNKMLRGIADEAPVSKTGADQTRPTRTQTSSLKMGQTAEQVHEKSLRELYNTLNQINQDILRHEALLESSMEQSFTHIMQNCVYPLIKLNLQKTENLIASAHIEKILGKPGHTNLEQEFNQAFAELERTMSEMDELARSAESDTPEGEKALSLFKQERAGRVKICVRFSNALEDPAEAYSIEDSTRLRIDLVYQAAEPIYQTPDTIPDAIPEGLQQLESSAQYVNVNPWLTTPDIPSKDDPQAPSN